MLWLLFALALIGSILEIATIGLNPVGYFVMAFDALLVLGYFLGAYFTGKSKPWGFWLAFGTFSFTTLIGLLNFTFNPMMMLFFLLFRGLFIWFFASSAKHAIAVYRLQSFDEETIWNSELLDK